MSDIGSAGAGSALRYDRVVIAGPNGLPKHLSRREFEALPLRERVSYLIEGKAKFFAQGIPVSASQAMKG
jgi:hypothetical protein